MILKILQIFPLYSLTVWVAFLQWTSLHSVLRLRLICFAGYERLQADIKLMLGKHIGLYWLVTWKFLSPAALLVSVKIWYDDRISYDVNRKPESKT